MSPPCRSPPRPCSIDKLQVVSFVAASRPLRNLLAAKLILLRVCACTSSREVAWPICSRGLITSCGVFPASGPNGISSGFARIGRIGPQLESR